MDALVILVLFVALALLAVRFGRDSREHLVSAEEAFARHGVAWDHMTVPPPPRSALAAAELSTLPRRHRALALTLAGLVLLALAAGGGLAPSVASAPASSAPAAAAPEPAVAP